MYLYTFGVLINGTLFLLHLPRTPASLWDLGDMALSGFNGVVWFIAVTQVRTPRRPPT